MDESSKEQDTTRAIRSTPPLEALPVLIYTALDLQRWSEAADCLGILGKWRRAAASSGSRTRTDGGDSLEMVLTQVLKRLGAAFRSQ